MTRKPAVLITGANGEIGHGLITALAAEAVQPIVTIDLTPLDPSLTRLVAREFTGSILDKGLLERLISPSSRSIACSTSRRCSRRAASSRRRWRTR